LGRRLRPARRPRDGSQRRHHHRYRLTPSGCGHDTLPAFTTFRLVNQGKELHHASLVRLGEGKTAADFQAGLAAAMKRPRAAAVLITFPGGPNACTLDDTAIATQMLEPGSYVFVC